jgi:metal transporter CNNM
MALLSLDPLHLKVLRKSGTPREKEAAANVLPLVKRHHQMVVTFLLTAAICAEALPLFLDRLTDVWIAIALSVSLIMIFRELIPHAVSSKVRQRCSGVEFHYFRQYGLLVGSRLRFFVWFLMVVMAPIAYPLACKFSIAMHVRCDVCVCAVVLECTIGHHGESFYRVS